MKEILIPVSPGELLDKITILRIKAERILDAQKLANVSLQLELLEKSWQDSGAAHEVAVDEQALQRANERLWDIENRIREKEAAQAFDAEFIALARSVYFYNDERAAIKARINAQLGSRIVEEKSYSEFRSAGTPVAGPAKS
ncbi:MAG TPA: DUF6165 family protein [Candidatus Binatia bacterium]|nr:DUF6165 family protein [Candidatus Binatia bacterium]